MMAWADENEESQRNVNPNTSSTKGDVVLKKAITLQIHRCSFAATTGTMHATGPQQLLSKWTIMFGL
jgi:hypothetical protein